MGIATSGPKSFLLATALKQKTRGVTLAGWKLVGMAMFTPAIGNVVYEGMFDAIKSSGRMEQPGRASLRGERRRDVSKQKIASKKRHVQGGPKVRPAHRHACLPTQLSPAKHPDQFTLLLNRTRVLRRSRGQPKLNPRHARIPARRIIAVTARIPNHYQNRTKDSNKRGCRIIGKPAQLPKQVLRMPPQILP
jgi:hypothetical protein